MRTASHGNKLLAPPAAEPRRRRHYKKPWPRCLLLHRPSSSSSSPCCSALPSPVAEKHVGDRGGDHLLRRRRRRRADPRRPAEASSGEALRELAAERRLQWLEDSLHADLEPLEQQEIRDAVLPAASVGRVDREGDRVHDLQRLDPLPGIRRGGARVQNQQPDPRLLRRKVLDAVEAPHVRLHGLLSGARGDPSVQGGVSQRLRPAAGLRQQAPVPVHLLHRPEAPPVNPNPSCSSASSLTTII